MSTLGCRLSIIKAFENSFVIGLAATLVLTEFCASERKGTVALLAIFGGLRTWELEEEANLELKLKRCTRSRDTTVPAREVMSEGGSSGGCYREEIDPQNSHGVQSPDIAKPHMPSTHHR